MGPLRILVVTTVHTPFDARIHHRQIRTLVADGCEVTYAAPWSATGSDATRVGPGVRVVDLPRATGRRRLGALAAARRTIHDLAPAHDVVLLHDPELVLAVSRRARRRTSVVLDVHEDLPASLVDRAWLPGWLRPLARRAAGALERHAERRLAGLLLAEHGYVDRFAGTHPVVPNLPWLPTNPPPAGSEHRVVYVGRLSIGRGVLEMVSLARELATDPNAPRVELVGPADAEVRPLLRRSEVEGVLTWHGFLPNSEAMAIVAGSLAGLSPLRDRPNYRHSMPTKVVEYLAHGVPALATPLAKPMELITASGGGEIVPFQAPRALADAVRQLAADPSHAARLGAAGRRHVASAYSWDEAAPGFVAHLRTMSAEGAGGGRAPDDDPKDEPHEAYEPRSPHDGFLPGSRTGASLSGGGAPTLSRIRSVAGS